MWSRIASPLKKKNDLTPSPRGVDAPIINFNMIGSMFVLGLWSTSSSYLITIAFAPYQGKTSHVLSVMATR